jgi:hypothetical protein
MTNPSEEPPSEKNPKRKRTADILEGITDFQEIASVDDLDAKVYDLAMKCNFEEDKWPECSSKHTPIEPCEI